MTDFEKWWNQQKEWGFEPELYSPRNDDTICILTEAKCSDNFRGYSGFVLQAEFDLDGIFIEAGVYE